MKDRKPIPTRNKVAAGIIVAAFLVIAAVVVGTSLGGGEGEREGSTAATEPLPDLEFALFDGTTANFADYRGQPLVINFWATWCPPCVAEMEHAFRPVQERLGDEVQFLGMDTQDDRAQAIRLVEQTGVLFDLGEDPNGSLFVELGGLGMPFTLFVSNDGRILERYNGPLTEGQLEQLIRDLLL